MFAYCNNSPANSKDIAGGRPKDIQDDYQAVPKGHAEQQNKPIVKNKAANTNPKGYYKSPVDAAMGFRYMYYKQSIDSQVEYGSDIYQTTFNSREYYYFQPPTIGTKMKVDIDTAPRNEGDIAVASVHTHVLWGNEMSYHFSKQDIKTYTANKKGCPYFVAYLIVPGGYLMGYGELTNGTIGEAWLVGDQGRYLFPMYANYLN